MPKFEIKLLGSDKNIYYLEVNAPDETTAKLKVLRRHPDLSFQILEVFPCGKIGDPFQIETLLQSPARQAVA